MRQLIAIGIGYLALCIAGIISIVTKYFGLAIACFIVMIAGLFYLRRILRSIKRESDSDQDGGLPGERWRKGDRDRSRDNNLRAS